MTYSKNIWTTPTDYQISYCWNSWANRNPSVEPDPHERVDSGSQSLSGLRCGPWAPTRYSCSEPTRPDWVCIQLTWGNSQLVSNPWVCLKPKHLMVYHWWLITMFAVRNFIFGWKGLRFQPYMRPHWNPIARPKNAGLVLAAHLQLMETPGPNRYGPDSLQCLDGNPDNTRKMYCGPSVISRIKSYHVCGEGMRRGHTARPRR